MNSETLLLPTNNEVTCDSAELKKFITEWLENDGWKFEDFPTFLKLVGVDTPVRLSNLKGSGRKSFTCITASEREIDIELNFGAWLFDYSEIRLTEGNEKHHFGSDVFNIRRNTQPNVFPVRRVIQKDGKKLDVYYEKWYFMMIFTFSETQKWSITVGWPFFRDDEDFKVDKEEKMDEIFWSISNQTPILDVFNKIQELLVPTDGDFSKYRDIRIYYAIKNGVDLDEVIFSDEEKDESIIYDSGDTYQYFREDNIWEVRLNNRTKIYITMKDRKKEESVLASVDLFEKVKEEIWTSSFM